MRNGPCIHMSLATRRSTDVLDSVCLRKAEVLVETVTHVGAIEDARMAAHRMKPFLHQVSNGGLPRARETRQPNDTRPLMLDGGARRLVHIDMLEVDVVRTAKREMQHSGANSLVTDAVDENEAARVAVFRVGVETDRLIKFELAHADFLSSSFPPPYAQACSR